MAQASGARAQLGYVVEATYGTTPATPNLQALAFTSFNADFNPTVLSDNSINPFRQKTSSKRGTASVEGALEVQLTPDNYDDFLESALGTGDGRDVR
jgi:hypothetical protein